MVIVFYKVHLLAHMDQKVDLVCDHTISSDHARLMHVDSRPIAGGCASKAALKRAYSRRSAPVRVASFFVGVVDNGDYVLAPINIVPHIVHTGCRLLNRVVSG